MSDSEFLLFEQANEEYNSRTTDNSNNDVSVPKICKHTTTIIERILSSA